MKTILLIIYLVVLLALSLLNIVNSKAKKKSVLAVNAILLYIAYGFVSMAINNVTANKLTYCLYDSVLLVVFALLAAGFLIKDCNDEEGMCCYGGFSLLYFFFERAMVLIPLIFIGLNPASASNTELIDNYNQISALYIAVMLVMDVARFFLIRIVFVRLLVLKDIRTVCETLIMLFFVNCTSNLISEPVMKAGVIVLLLIGCIMYYSMTGKKPRNVHK